MTVAEKLTKIAENEPKIYDAGKQEYYDKFWSALQSNGNRTMYNYAFIQGGWTTETLKPKYIVKPTQANYMFYGNTVLLDLTDPIYDFSDCVSYNNWLTYASVVKVPKIDVSKSTAGANSLFNQTAKLQTIVELALPSTAMTYAYPTANTFNNCIALKNITVSGTIANTGFDLHWSTNLTIESLTSILTALSKNSSVAAGKSITLPLAAQAKINADTTAKAQYGSAIAAGWTIAFS